MFVCIQSYTLLYITTSINYSDVSQTCLISLRHLNKHFHKIIFSIIAFLFLLESQYRTISYKVWRYLFDIYGGGPHLTTRSPETLEL